MIDATFLIELNRFSLAVRKRVTSKYIGAKKSYAAGRGLTFKDYRIYAPGDDFRLIDWRVYGRTDDLYVKTYEEERNLVAHILVDVSKSMDFGNKRTKYDFASMIGVGFAYLALKDNNKFQFSTFSNDLELFQARRGMGHLANIITTLNKTKTKGQSKMLDAISQYRKQISGTSLVILISDFLIPIEEIEKTLVSIGKHEVKVIQVLDKAEKDMEAEGDLKLKDAESGFSLRTFISSIILLALKTE